MGTHRHRRHSTELKLRLVQMYLSGEASLNGLAREHDISRNLIRVWLDKFHKGELSEKVDRAEKVREYEVKIAALERKIGQLTMEVEVLKNSGRHDRCQSAFNLDPRGHRNLAYAVEGILLSHRVFILYIAGSSLDSDRAIEWVIFRCLLTRRSRRLAQALWRRARIGPPCPKKAIGLSHIPWMISEPSTGSVAKAASTTSSAGSPMGSPFR